MDIESQARLDGTSEFSRQTSVNSVNEAWSEDTDAGRHKDALLTTSQESVFSISTRKNGHVDGGNDDFNGRRQGCVSVTCQSFFTSVITSFMTSILVIGLFRTFLYPVFERSAHWGAQVY